MYELWLVEMQLEKWEYIKDLDDRYMISDKGRVKSLVGSKEKILKPQKDNDGYLLIKLRNKNQKQFTYKIHRLVALHFIPQIEGKNEVNHIDGDKTNNTVENLEWCNRKENVQHSYDNKLNYSKKCPILCTTNGKIYSSQLEASIDLKISRKAIKNVLDKKQETTKGFHFEYASKPLTKYKN